MSTAPKISPILARMNDYELRCRAIHKANLKGIDKEVIDSFCDPEQWKIIYKLILFNVLDFGIDHEGRIPKKDAPGEFRDVSIGVAESRIIMAIVNEVLFELYGPIMIHPSAKAYQKGLGNGKVVQECSNAMLDFFSTREKKNGKAFAVKMDYSKFFDTVYKHIIFKIFDRIEELAGFDKNEEPVMNMCRRIYSNDWFIQLDGTRVKKYRGLRQGNALASFLANVVLYDIDDYMSKKYPYYVRYSDDSIVIADDPWEAERDVQRMIKAYGVKLNPRKVEILRVGKWFKFLGFSLREDGQISLSKRRMKNFAHEIKIRTISLCGSGITYKKALSNVLKYMYKGNGEHSFATSCLTIINNEHDIDMMNRYVMDCLRGVITGKHEIWGIGYNVYGIDGVIPFEEGTNVAMNKEKIPILEGYDIISHYRHLLINSRDVYDAKVRLIA